MDENIRSIFGEPATLADFEELHRIVADHYREDARFQALAIYRRR